MGCVEMQAKTASPISTLAAKPNCVNRRERWDLFSIRESLSLKSLTSLLCKWCDAFRSFRGHIRIQAARIDAGPAGQFLHGRYQPNERTLARVEGIRKLQATHPWVDRADAQIFLMGFDVGEEYSIRSQVARSRSIPDIPHSPRQNQEDSSSAILSGTVGAGFHCR